MSQSTGASSFTSLWTCTVALGWAVITFIQKPGLVFSVFLLKGSTRPELQSFWTTQAHVLPGAVSCKRQSHRGNFFKDQHVFQQTLVKITCTIASQANSLQTFFDSQEILKQLLSRRSKVPPSSQKFAAHFFPGSLGKVDLISARLGTSDAKFSFANHWKHWSCFWM